MIENILNEPRIWQTEYIIFKHKQYHINDLINLKNKGVGHGQSKDNRRLYY